MRHLLRLVATGIALAACAPALAAGLPVPDPIKVADGYPFDLRHGPRRMHSGPERSLAVRPGPRRVVVGVARRGDLGPIRRKLRALSTEIEVLRPLRAIVATVRAADSVAARLANDPRVRYVEEDRPLDWLGDPFDSVDPETGLSYQWAYDNVNAAAALAAAGGGSAFPVAVIDTGVDVAHPEFTGRILGTYSAMDGSADVTDELGHGTFVAGLVAAVDGNGVGGKGVGGATSILAVKASAPGGEFYETQLADGIVWAVQAGARVINMSPGGRCPSGGVILTALDYAHERNVVLVAAAGNNAEAANAPNCPAADLTSAQGGWGMGLSVAALRPDGQRASFSTFNDNVGAGPPSLQGKKRYRNVGVGVSSLGPRPSLTSL